MQCAHLTIASTVGDFPACAYHCNAKHLSIGEARHVLDDSNKGLETQARQRLRVMNIATSLWLPSCTAKCSAWCPKLAMRDLIKLLASQTCFSRPPPVLTVKSAFCHDGTVCQKVLLNSSMTTQRTCAISCNSGGFLRPSLSQVLHQRPQETAVFWSLNASPT